MIGDSAQLCRLLRRGFALFGLALLVLRLLAPPSALAQDEQGLWDALAEPGTIALMRHAIAPGTGDPENFELGDCSTQRILDARGRQQARETGAAFREHGISVARVLTSEWCRCTQTAELLGVAPVETFPPLNSFFRNRDRGPEQTAAVERFLADWSGEETLVMVTHQVNITALLDIFPNSGEVIVVRPGNDGSPEVLGRLGPF